MNTNSSGRKVAIVTGSATGVGAATALALSRRGYDLVINYSKSEREAKEAEAACRDAGADTLLVRGNVADDADCRNMANAAVARWNRLDALVNNAGISTFTGGENWDALDAAVFQRIFGVNVLGAFQMVRACRSLLEAAERPSVLMTSSIAAVTGIGSSVAYAASKGALNTMTLSLARALAPKIRVNAICPGFIDTRWFSGAFSEETTQRIRDNITKNTPLKAASKPEDIADSALFLISDAARHITGETLMIDAGLHLGFAPMTRR